MAADKDGPLYKKKSWVLYFPWVFTFSLILFVIVICVWAAYVVQTSNQGSDAGDSLQADFTGTDSMDAIAGTLLAVWLSLAIVLTILTVIRHIAEFKHDTTSKVSAGSAIWLGFSALLSVLHWIVFIWFVTVVGAGAAYTVSLVILYDGIQNLQNTYGVQGPANNNPSQTTQPCPGWCLNYQLLPFVSGNNDITCFCNYAAMDQAKSQLDDGINFGFIMIGSSLFVVLTGLGILTNFQAQYSHMLRERDYLQRYDLYKRYHENPPPQVLLATEPVPAAADAKNSEAKAPVDEEAPPAEPESHEDSPEPQSAPSAAKSPRSAAPQSAPSAAPIYPPVPAGAP